MSDMQEIKKTQDEISGVLNEFQSTFSEFKEGVSTNRDTIENMKKAFEDLSVKNDEMGASIEAETKAREELELAMARIQDSGGDPNEIKSNPEYKNAFSTYLRERKNIDPEISDIEMKSMVNKEAGRILSDQEFVAVKTLLVGSNPDGGYNVPVDRSAKIEKRRFETTPMRRLATVESTSTEAKEWVLDDEEFGSEKVGELDARAETDTSQIGIITIPVHEQYAEPRTTQKNLDDSLWNVEAWISGKLVERFSRVENAETINGSGAHEMQGICALPDWTTLGVYEREALETRDITGAAGASIAADDLIDLQSDLLEGYQSNANWLIHRKIWAEIMKLKDDNDQYLLNPQMLFAGVSPQLLGKPVVMSGDMAKPNATGEYTADSIVALYGDFREGYVMLDRLGMRVLRDPYTTKGVVKFYTTKRTGGGVVNFQAIKRLAVPSSDT